MTILLLTGPLLSLSWIVLETSLYRISLLIDLIFRNSGLQSVGTIKRCLIVYKVTKEFYF